MQDVEFDCILSTFNNLAWRRERELIVILSMHLIFRFASVLLSLFSDFLFNSTIGWLRLVVLTFPGLFI